MLTQTQTYRSIFSNQTKLIDFSLIFMASVALAFISQIAIPFHPVPLTFQSATVVLFGLMMGSKRATAAVALYLFEGALGLPVFAEGHAGIAVLLADPTAGYLWGFLPAAYLSGLLMEKGMASRLPTIFASAFLGALVIFACGVTVLQLFIGWKNAVVLGVMPFAITEPLKLMAASFFARFCWKK